MFKLRYQIFETDEELHKNINHMKKDEFTIHGFISLVFNSNKVGFIMADEGIVNPNLKENKIYLYDDDLCWWLETLLRVSKVLDSQDYVRFQILESWDMWISLEKHDKKLIATSFRYYDAKAQDVISLEKINSEDIRFCEEIGLEEFKSAVYNQTKNFLKELKNINSDLLKLNEIIELIEFIL